MKHVFILNPAAGKNGHSLRMKPMIEAFFATHPAEYCIHVTEYAGHATQLARQAAAEAPVRVYACGGDGTVLEVLNGIVGVPGAELACVPCGSGNDFLRMFPHPECFGDLEAVVNGKAYPMDALRCNDKWSLNTCAMGMDATVADRMIHYKRWPLIKGPMAYNLAIARTFFGRLGQKLHIVMDTVNGTVERTGHYLFALAANGQYYGGGYHGSPRSQPNDGLLDFILVKDLNHLTALSFLGKYKNGQHLGLSCCEWFRGTRMQVFADTPAVVTADGECFRTTDVTFSVVPGAISFVCPASAETDLLKNCEMPAFFQIGT